MFEPMKPAAPVTTVVGALYLFPMPAGLRRARADARLPSRVYQRRSRRRDRHAHRFRGDAPRRASPRGRDHVSPAPDTSYTSRALVDSWSLVPGRTGFHALLAPRQQSASSPGRRRRLGALRESSSSFQRRRLRAARPVGRHHVRAAVPRVASPFGSTSTRLPARARARSSVSMCVRPPCRSRRGSRRRSAAGDRGRPPACRPAPRGSRRLESMRRSCCCAHHAELHRVVMVGHGAGWRQFDLPRPRRRRLSPPRPHRSRRAAPHPRQSRSVARHVAAPPAAPRCARPSPRARGLREYSGHFPEPVAVEHHVADHEQPGAARRSRALRRRAVIGYPRRPIGDTRVRARDIGGLVQLRPSKITVS